MDLEMTLGQRYRSELAHKSQDYCSKLRKKEKHIRDCERRLVTIENDKDKYKRLYTNEKSVNVLQKPTLANRYKNDDLTTALITYEENRKDTPPKRRPRRRTKTKEEKEKEDLTIERMTFKTRPKIARRVKKSIEKKEEVKERESIVVSLPSIEVRVLVFLLLFIYFGLIGKKKKVQ